MPSDLKSVLFVSTKNRCRSPLAEALFRKYLENKEEENAWRVGSAGTWTEVDLPASRKAFRKSEELELDLDEHRSIEVNDAILAGYNLIIVMEMGHKEALRTEFPDFRERIFLLSDIVDDVNYDIPNPECFLESGDAIISELYNLVQRGYTDICDLVDEMEQELVLC